MTNVRFSRGSILLRAAALALGVLAATGQALAASSCPPNTDPDLCIDDFNCYQAMTTEGTPRFQKIDNILLTDQFESATVSATKVRQLCLPTDRDEEGTVDTNTHLQSYAIRRQSPEHIRRGSIRVTNDLEEIRVDTIRPDLLLVPTGKSLVLPAPPVPDPGDHTVDHYKCYLVKVSPGTPKAEIDRKISVQDQFTPEKLYTLRRPRHLCLPVNKNGESIKNPNVHLLCYRGHAARGEVHFIPRRGIFVNNQFGDLRVDASRENEFCIPSRKSLSPSGAFLDEGCE